MSVSHPKKWDASGYGLARALAWPCACPCSCCDQPCGWLHLNEWVMSSATCDNVTETSVYGFSTSQPFFSGLINCNRMSSLVPKASSLLHLHTLPFHSLISHAHIRAVTIIYYASLSGAVPRTTGWKHQVIWQMRMHYLRTSLLLLVNCLSSMPKLPAPS